MVIKRSIGGEMVSIELTQAELNQAHQEARRKMVEDYIRYVMYSAIKDVTLDMNKPTEICGIKRTGEYILSHAGSDEFVKSVAEKFLALPECKGDSTEIVTLERAPLLKKAIAEFL